MAARNKKVDLLDEGSDMYGTVPDADYYDEHFLDALYDRRESVPATRPINIGRDRMWEAFMKAGKL